MLQVRLPGLGARCTSSQSSRAQLLNVTPCILKLAPRQGLLCLSPRTLALRHLTAHHMRKRLSQESVALRRHPGRRCRRRPRASSTQATPRPPGQLCQVPLLYLQCCLQLSLLSQAITCT